MEQRKHQEEGTSTHRHGSHGHPAEVDTSRHKGPVKPSVSSSGGFRARMWAVGMVAAAAAGVWSVALVRKCEAEDAVPTEVGAPFADVLPAVTGASLDPIG